MLEGDFDTVAMLDQYTEHLMVNLVEIIKKISSLENPRWLHEQRYQAAQSRS